MLSSTQPNGYLAIPSVGKGRGVLVLHAWWGLNDTIKACCNRLADVGFVAFAPDLYHGMVTDQIAAAESLSAPLFEDLNQPRATLATAIAFLKERAGAGDVPVAVIGFSLGAFFALDASVNHPQAVQAVVVFYGTHPGAFSGSQASYLGHFAAHDPFEPPASVKALAAALNQASRPVTFYHYDSTGHWFVEPDRADAYNPTAAALAWERTLEFLQGALRLWE